MHARSSRLHRGIALGLLAVALAQPLVGQSSIASDRPGLGRGSPVVTPGILQFELGGEFADDHNIDRISLGQGLMRFGVVDGFELQGLLGSFTVLPGDDDGTRGLLDIGLGAKLRLPSPSDAVSWALLGTVLFPTGADRFTADEVLPAGALLADLAVSRQVNVTANVGVSGLAADAVDQLFASLTPSITLGDSSVALYGGYAGYYSKSDDLHYVEAGLTWLRSPDLQLDLNGGVEVESGGYFVGVGVAKRWSLR